MKKFIIIGIIVVAIIAIVAGLAILRKMQGITRIVEAGKAEKRSIESTVVAFGRVEPKSDVNISSEVTEKIERLYIEEGDTVKSGDMLVLLNQDRYKAALSRAEASVTQVEANLRKARDNLQKVQELRKTGAVSDDGLLASQSEVAVLEAQLQSARAALDEAQNSLSQTIIKSPLDGIVTSLQAEKGEFVIVGTMNNPGSVIMTIAQLTDMQAEVDVDEADVVELEPGQYTKVELDAVPDTFFAGTVVQVAHQAKVQSVGGEETRASFEVHIAIIDPSPKIRPGMSVTATITTAQHDSVLSVPLSAVVAYQDSNDSKKAEGEGLFTIRDGIANKVRVRTGISDDKYIEVLEGLTAEEMVVSGPFKVLRELEDGDKVRISEGFGKLKGKGSPDGRPRERKSS